MTMLIIFLGTMALSLLAAALVRSTYNRYNQGRVLSGPPPQPLRQFHHQVRGDRLVIALEKENLEKAP